MMALFARRRSASVRAVRDAGPPNRLVILAAALGLLIDLALWFLGPTRGWPWPVLAIAPTAFTTYVAVADRDGWLVRRAMAFVAVQQRTRWTRPAVPGTPDAAEAWLVDPANEAAPPLERASVLIAAGRHGDAEALVETMAPERGSQRAAVVRMRAFLEGQATGSMDLATVRREIDGLGLDETERRYQRTSAAWTQAWMDVEWRRPWRATFADAIRDLGPAPVSPRLHWLIALQQGSAPFAIILATIFMSVFYPP